VTYGGQFFLSFDTAHRIRVRAQPPPERIHSRRAAAAGSASTLFANIENPIHVGRS
jgi:hypothetical protein